MGSETGRWGESALSGLDGGGAYVGLRGRAKGQFGQRGGEARAGACVARAGGGWQADGAAKNGSRANPRPLRYGSVAGKQTERRSCGPGMEGGLD